MQQDWKRDRASATASLSITSTTMCSSIAGLSLSLSPDPQLLTRGCCLGIGSRRLCRKARDVGRARDFVGAAVGGDELDVGESPVFGIRNRAGGGSLNVEMAELEIGQRCIRVCCNRECTAGARRVNIPDVHVGEVREPMSSGTGV